MGSLDQREDMAVDGLAWLLWRAAQVFGLPRCSLEVPEER